MLKEPARTAAVQSPQPGGTYGYDGIAGRSQRQTGVVGSERQASIAAI